jgi:hypothetical protein
MRLVEGCYYSSERHGIRTGLLHRRTKYRRSDLAPNGGKAGFPAGPADHWSSPVRPSATTISRRVRLCGIDTLSQCGRSGRYRRATEGGKHHNPPCMAWPAIDKSPAKSAAQRTRDIPEGDVPGGAVGTAGAAASRGSLPARFESSLLAPAVGAACFSVKSPAHLARALSLLSAETPQRPRLRLRSLTPPPPAISAGGARGPAGQQFRAAARAADRAGPGCPPA